MAQYVEAFGQTLEFPDAMSQTDIAAAIKKSALNIPRQSAAATPPTMWDTAKSGAGSALDGAGNLFYGLAKGAADPVYGLSQLAMHGANALTGGALAGPTSAYDKMISQVENTYQGDTAGSIAAGTGRFLANVAGPVKGFSLARETPLVLRALNATGTGAAVGATQPVYGSGAPTLDDLVAGKTPADYWKEKAVQTGVGALVGGGMSAGGSMLGGAYNAVRPLISPKTAAGDILMSGISKAGTAGGTKTASGANVGAGDIGAFAIDPKALAARLQTAQPLIPGSQPTTAQVAGLPELVMAEKTLTNNPNYRGAFEDRSIANNAARLAALRGVAGTPEALAAAVKARSDLTEPLYSAANAEVHPIDDALGSILNRPSAQAALARGQKLAAEKGESADLTAGTPAIPDTQVPSTLLGANGQPTMSTVPGQPAVPGTIGGKTLQYLKMGIDDLQKEGKTQGMGSHEANALGATRSDLDGWLVNNSPAFKSANNAYRDASVPINTMEVGQALHGDLAGGTLNAAGDIAPALSQYKNRYAAALKGSQYGIDPEAQKTLDAIQDDLQRETISNSIRAKSGSDTAFNLQAPNWLGSKLFGDNMDGKSNLARGLGALGGFFTGGPVGAAGGVMAAQKIGSFAGDRVNSALQSAMLDPKLFAKLLSDAAARAGQQPGLLDGALPKAGVLGADDAATGLLSPGS